MKKNLILIALIFSLTLSACSSYNWDRSDPNMPQELKTKYQTSIDKYSEIIKTDPANIDAQFEVGFGYERLGDYENAVKYYEKVLELDNVNFPAINNLAAIYEEIGDYKTASTYIERLMKAYPDNQEALSDAIRILLKANNPEGATVILEEFARQAKGSATPETIQFIGDLYGTIYNYKNKTK